MLLYNSTEETDINKQQWFFPSMKFSCGGNITKWTFVARSRIGGDRNQYPQFQLWRLNETGIYRRVYESSVTSTMSGQSDFTVDPLLLNVGELVGL